MMWLKSLCVDASHGESFFAGFARGLAEGEIVHLRDGHVLTPLPRSPDIYRLLSAVLGTVGAREHHRPAGIGDQADIQQVEGIAHRPRFEHILDREGVAEARFGIEGGPLARRHRDLRPLLQTSCRIRACGVW